MRIALVAPVEETIPPRRYGGTEWIVYELAEALGKKHTVDLFAAADSPTSPNYNIIPITEKSLRSDLESSTDLKLREAQKLISIANAVFHIQNGNYDIVHNHASWRFLSFSDLIKKPVITTHHNPLSIHYQKIVFKKFKDRPHVSISNNQRKDLPELNFVATIYNGILLKDYPFLEYSDKIRENPFLLYLARMSEEKGAVEAAKAAAATEKKLFVAAKVDEVNKDYFAKFEKVANKEFVEFAGEISPDLRLAYLQNSIALLAPIQWEEPFGLMFTEAMACGTPVISYSRGSAPEIIVDGVTGFLVNESDEFIRGNYIIKKTGVEGLQEAIKRIYEMPKEEYVNMRRASRKHVEDHFTSEKMVSEYEKVYEEITRNDSTKTASL